MKQAAAHKAGLFSTSEIVVRCLCSGYLLLKKLYFKLQNISLLLTRCLFFIQMVVFRTLFWRWSMLWNSTLKLARLFQSCLTSLTSTLKSATLVWRCSMLHISTLKYTTFFHHWLDFAGRRKVISTKEQSWNNVKMFLGLRNHTCKSVNYWDACSSFFPWTLIQHLLWYIAFSEIYRNSNFTSISTSIVANKCINFTLC